MRTIKDTKLSVVAIPKTIWYPFSYRSTRKPEINDPRMELRPKQENKNENT